MRQSGFNSAAEPRATKRKQPPWRLFPARSGFIGSGFSSLAAAACLAKEGFDVTVFEKNNDLGGRCRKFEADGFLFDRPSWYWMPEVFENFYGILGKKVSDFYELIRLNPSYSVIFGQNDNVEIPADYNELKNLFEKLEKGSAANLDTFLADAEYKYNVGMTEFVWKPGHSIMEFADFRVVQSLFKLQMRSSISSQIDKLFKNEKLRNILKFPVLFLGATPENTPALYSLMNYADLKLGTWYPMGGMHKITHAFVAIAKSQGVKFMTDNKVISVECVGRKAKSLTTTSGKFKLDYIVAGGDYHHVDQTILPGQYKNYTADYWDKRVMAPSSLLFYIGLNTKLKNVQLPQHAEHNADNIREVSLRKVEILGRHDWRREEVVPQRIGPILIEDHHRIRIVLEFLRHFLTILGQDDTVHNHLLKRIGLLNPRPHHVLVIKPSSSLINSFGNKLRRESRFKLFFVLKRIMHLSIRHRTRIKPCIEHVRSALHRRTTLLKRDRNLVDDVLVEISYFHPARCFKFTY